MLYLTRFGLDEVCNVFCMFTLGFFVCTVLSYNFLLLTCLSLDSIDTYFIVLHNLLLNMLIKVRETCDSVKEH